MDSNRRAFFKKLALGIGGLPLLASEAISEVAQPATDPVSFVPQPEPLGPIDWFNEARFGMFVHWGSISLMNGCWGGYLERETLWPSYVDRVREEFAPPPFPSYTESIDPALEKGPAAWAKLAKQAGMKYVVLTARHHDGFCLWRTQTTDFNSFDLRQRDFVQEYVDACRAAGLKVGLYYSLMDWRFAGYWEPALYPESAAALVDMVLFQLYELLTNYGPIDILWSDGHWLEGRDDPFDPDAILAFWRADELLNMARFFQPNMIINDRMGAQPPDFTTTEQEVEGGVPGAWEACMTIPDNHCWSYVPYSSSRKSTGQLLGHLASASQSGGNYLLNIGPRPDGGIVDAERQRLQQMGEWMRVYGEAVYGSQATWLPETMIAHWNRKGTTGYLMVYTWPGSGELAMPLVDTPVVSATLLGTNQPVSFRREYNGRLLFTGLPMTPPDPWISVIKVEFASEPQPLGETDQASWAWGDVV